MVTIRILIEGGVLIDVEVCLPFYACIGTFALYILPFSRCLIYYCILNELLVCKNSDILLAYIYNSFCKNILYYICFTVGIAVFFSQVFKSALAVLMLSCLLICCSARDLIRVKVKPECKNDKQQGNHYVQTKTPIFST